MIKTQILIKKTFSGLLILDQIKIVLYEFWYDYVKSIYDENPKFCYTDIDKFIVCIKIDNIYNKYYKWFSKKTLHFKVWNIPSIYHYIKEITKK